MENTSLKQLLNIKGEIRPNSITARVITMTGAPLTANYLITAGRRDGIKPNMAAISEDGLVGRVIESGTWSARILALTDPDSRIPVMTEDGGIQGVLAGDGSAQLNLRFAPDEARFPAGTRLVTSGHGGLFPPHLPVGIAVESDQGNVVWLPLSDLHRQRHVRLLDYGLSVEALANPSAPQDGSRVK